MAKTSRVSIGITVEGDGETGTYVPPTSPITNATAPQGGPIAYALSAGNNVITIPTGAIGVIIVPAATNGNAKTLKGVAGDTGVALRTNAPSVISFATGSTVFSINATGTETVDLHWF